jgi:hypothetical protein
MNIKYAAIFAALGICISACGGGGSGDSGAAAAPPAPAPPPPPPTNAGGVWEGSTFNNDNGQTFQTVGVITENNGEARFFNDQGQQIVLSSISGSGGDISATLTGYAAPGTTFLDGKIVTTGTFTGTVVERTSISGTWSVGTGETGTMTMSYDDIYERGADFARTIGTWIDSFGVVYSVDAAGEIFAQDATGCVYNGTVGVIDSSYNAYRVTMTVSDCPGLNGDYVGLGVLTDEVGLNDAFVVQLDNGSQFLADVLLKQ